MVRLPVTRTVQLHFPPAVDRDGAQRLERSRFPYPDGWPPVQLVSRVATVGDIDHLLTIWSAVGFGCVRHASVSLVPARDRAAHRPRRSAVGVPGRPGMGIETSPTADARPIATPPARHNGDGTVVFTWNTISPLQPTRYRTEWRLRSHRALHPGK